MAPPKKVVLTPAAPTTGKRHLTPKQWAEAEALWECGEVTSTDLGARFGVSKQSILSHMSNVGCKHASKAAEHKAKVAAEVTKAAITDATVVATRIRETKEDHYKMAMGIAKLAWNEVLTAKANGAPMSASLNNLKALDSAMTVMAKARSERWIVLGLDRDDAIGEGGLPELIISELTADQVAELRNRDSTLEDLPDMGGCDEDEGDGDDEAFEG